MYKHEKVIDGVLCVRFHPDSEYQPYSAEQLTSKLIHMRRHLEAIEHVVKDDYLLYTHIEKTER